MTHNTTIRAPTRRQLQVAAKGGWAAPADASTPRGNGLGAVRCPA